MEGPGCLLVLLAIVGLLFVSTLYGKTFPGLGETMIHKVTRIHPYVIWIVWGLVVAARLWTAWCQWKMEPENSKVKRYANRYWAGVGISSALMFLLMLFAAVRDFGALAAMPETIGTVSKVLGRIALLALFPFVQPSPVERWIDDLPIRGVRAQTLFCLIGGMAFYLFIGGAFGVLPWQW